MDSYIAVAILVVLGIVIFGLLVVGDSSMLEASRNASESTLSYVFNKI